jgi:hypothetical protein
VASVILNTFARNCPASAAFPPSNYLHPCTWLKSSTYYAAVPPFLIPYDSYPVHLLPKVALSKKSPYVPTSHRVSGLMLANNTSIRCGAQAHIHTNMYTHTYTHIHIHTPKYTYTHSYSHTHTHTHICNCLLTTILGWSSLFLLLIQSAAALLCSPRTSSKFAQPALCHVSLTGHK